LRADSSRQSRWAVGASLLLGVGRGGGPALAREKRRYRTVRSSVLAGRRRTAALSSQSLAVPALTRPRRNAALPPEKGLPVPPGWLVVHRLRRGPNARLLYAIIRSLFAGDKGPNLRGRELAKVVRSWQRLTQVRGGSVRTKLTGDLLTEPEHTRAWRHPGYA